MNPLLVPNEELTVPQDHVEALNPRGAVAQDFELGDVVFDIADQAGEPLLRTWEGAVDLSRNTIVPQNPARFYAEQGYGDVVLYRLWARQK